MHNNRNQVLDWNKAGPASPVQDQDQEIGAKMPLFLGVTFIFIEDIDKSTNRNKPDKVYGVSYNPFAPNSAI